MSPNRARPLFFFFSENSPKTNFQREDEGTWTERGIQRTAKGRAARAQTRKDTCFTHDYVFCRPVSAFPLSPPTRLKLALVAYPRRGFFRCAARLFFFSPIHPLRAASFDPLFWHFCFQQTDGKRRNKNGCQKNGHPPILSEESLKKGRISDSKLPPRRNQRPRFSTSACSILFANCEDEERFASKQNGNQLPVFFSVFGRFCRT